MRVLKITYPVKQYTEEDQIIFSLGSVFFSFFTFGKVEIKLPLLDKKTRRVMWRLRSSCSTRVLRRASTFDDVFLQSKFG